MKKTCVLILLVLLVGFLLPSCVSMGVDSMGKEYFIGKSESVIVKYFDGEATSIDDDEEGIYDKVSWFTNRGMSVIVTKENITRYKVTNKKKIFDLSYHEFPDGCRHTTVRPHYSLPHGVGGYAGGEHQPNDNVYINDRINYFNNQVKRLQCIEYSEENAYLRKSNVGDTFYVAGVDYLSTNNVTVTSEGYVTFHSCTIWEVNVGLKEDVETERHTAVRYSERTNEYYNEKGNVISEGQVDNIIADYTNRGFGSDFISYGLSILAYIKDGKVVKVEDFDPGE